MSLALTWISYRSFRFSWDNLQHRLHLFQIKNKQKDRTKEEAIISKFIYQDSRKKFYEKIQEIGIWSDMNKREGSDFWKRRNKINQKKGIVSLDKISTSISVLFITTRAYFSSNFLLVNFNPIPIFLQNK